MCFFSIKCNWISNFRPMKHYWFPTKKVHFPKKRNWFSKTFHVGKSDTKTREKIINVGKLYLQQNVLTFRFITSLVNLTFIFIYQKLTSHAFIWQCQKLCIVSYVPCLHTWEHNIGFRKISIFHIFIILGSLYVFSWCCCVCFFLL